MENENSTIKQELDHIRNSINQKNETESDDENSNDYIFEPQVVSLLRSIAPKYVQNQVFHSVLEAFASEHSARMVAMQNATDNANELVEGLTLDLNKARQESITGEVLDIVGGVAALEK